MVIKFHHIGELPSTHKITSQALDMNHLFGDIGAMRNRIREHRERLGWSQEKLAAAVDTSMQQISRLERGERGLNDEWLTRLSAAMKVRKADLLADAFVVPGSTPGECDFFKDEKERSIIRFWRRLSPEAKDFFINLIEAFAAKWLPSRQPDRQLEG